MKSSWQTVYYYKGHRKAARLAPRESFETALTRDKLVAFFIAFCRATLRVIAARAGSLYGRRIFMSARATYQASGS